MITKKRIWNLGKRILKYAKNTGRYLTLAPRIIRDGGHLAVNIAYVSDGTMLQGKRVLITGGSSGIGYAIASKAVNQGARVVITGRQEDRLKQAIEGIGSNNIEYMVWDVTDLNSIPHNVDVAISLLGGDIDILINNAGILSNSVFPTTTPSDWETTYNTNSRAPYFIAQAIATRWMASSEKSVKKIINLSSQGAFVGATYPYRLTKWDVVGLTQGLGVLLAPHNILVSGIAPGIVSTAMQEGFARHGEITYCPVNPVNRTATPGEIAELASFMMSDVSNFMVGQTIVCDGGFSIA